MTLRIAPRIRRALKRGRPAVALESTVVSHGLPRPRNVELARRLEQVVREAGAEPATVGVIAGELVVGVDAAELDRLAAGGAAKASLWNLAALCAAGRDAGTTVATTLHAAALAGVRVFATGGIGGVHREAFDESADLAALARYPLVTVCAGPKSILDAEATAERLESAGVPLIGYRSDRLAGFHTAFADPPVAARCDDPEAVAQVFRNQRRLGLPGGVLVSQPVEDGLDPTELAALLERAHADATAAGVRGKDVTPYLLARLAELSDGRTVEVNLRLLEANAALAAAIAVALAATGAPDPEPQPLASHASGATP